MKKINTKYRVEVESRLIALARNYPESRLDYYNSKLHFLGDIPVPFQRKAFKEGYSFSTLNDQEQALIWISIWNSSNYFEVLSQALFFFQNKTNKLQWEDWVLLQELSTRIDNWAHSDMLSGLYAELHEKFPKKMYPILSAWSKSPEPWLRRLAVVSLLYYSSARKTRVPSFASLKKMIMQLLGDDHFYVQKGVGWTLREMYNIYPEETFLLLQKIAHKIPPAGWYAASEKLTKREKALLLKIRKAR